MKPIMLAMLALAMLAMVVQVPPATEDAPRLRLASPPPAPLCFEWLPTSCDDPVEGATPMCTFLMARTEGVAAVCLGDGCRAIMAGRETEFLTLAMAQSAFDFCTYPDAEDTRQ